MGKEVKGHYIRKRRALLKEFKETMDLVKRDTGYGKLLTDEVEKELIMEFENIIPEIHYFKGYRQRMFNGMLLLTAQTLAPYRVLKRRGMTTAEIWEICHHALELRLGEIPDRKKRFMKRLWNTQFRRMMMGRARRNVKETMGHFELEYISGEKEDFDYGINYLKCGHRRFLEEQDALELLPYLCLADLALSDVFGWGLARTRTIGDGCDYCDFRFTRGAPTRISSKTPEVQAMIDRLKN